MSGAVAMKDVLQCLVYLLSFVKPMNAGCFMNSQLIHCTRTSLIA